MWLDVLTAFAVVSLTGLLFGVLLAVCSHFFAVPDDEKVKQIRAVLPGANCGACGYKGCNDYAEAVASGNAAPNLCIPGALAVAEQLGEILGVEVEEPKDVVALVHCNGDCTACGDKAIYDGMKTCHASTAFFGGPKACSYGCIGCGDCAAVCISDAICMENGIARVDSSRCVGCGLCAKTCPKHIISMVPQDTKVVVYCVNHDKGAEARKACQNACIGCKKCEKLCPLGAITVVDNCAVVDYEKCQGCGVCAEGCPTKCLKKVFLPDLPEDFVLNKV